MSMHVKGFHIFASAMRHVRELKRKKGFGGFLFLTVGHDGIIVCVVSLAGPEEFELLFVCPLARAPEFQLLICGKSSNDIG